MCGDVDCAKRNEHKYIVFIYSLDLNNSLIKYTYHCSYLKTHFYINNKYDSHICYISECHFLYCTSKGFNHKCIQLKIVLYKVLKSNIQGVYLPCLFGSVCLK